MRIIARSTLQKFWESHNESEQFLKSWYHEISSSEYNCPNDIIYKYPKASVLTDNRIVFRIKWNDYRIVVKVNYDYQILWIRFIWTHAEYDKINAHKI